MLIPVSKKETNFNAPNPYGIGGFKKGQSGNPKGRSKKDTVLAEMAREYTKEALETIVSVMREAKEPKERVYAAKLILERGYGTAPQSIDVKHSGEVAPLLHMVFTEAPAIGDGRGDGEGLH